MADRANPLRKAFVVKKFFVFLAHVLAFLVLLPTNALAGNTEETVALSHWLLKNRERPALGAQWNGGVKTIGWDDQARITGKEPLVFGVEYYDYGSIEKNLVGRETGVKYLKEKYLAGGIVTLVDHMPNFVTGGNSWDRNGDPLTAVLPGGVAHTEFVAYLDRLASYLKSLTVNGKNVPVLFRPFHEMNGGWFWWGNAKSGEQLVSLWQFCHDYLVREKGVRNLLWVWSPNIDKTASVARFMGYWPGPKYVDVVGLDGYDNTPVPNIANESFVRSFKVVSEIASRFSLPLAFTEIGARPGAQELVDFWDAGVLTALRKDFQGLSYILVWNAEWGPKDGTPAAAGFRRMVESGYLLRLKDVSGVQIYGPGFGR